MAWACTALAPLAPRIVGLSLPQRNQPTRRAAISSLHRPRLRPFPHPTHPAFNAREYTISSFAAFTPPATAAHSSDSAGAVGTASDRSAAHRAGRMGIFTLGKSSPVATEVPRRAYINQPAHPSHKSFCDNSMVRRGPLLAPHTWVASCLPRIARRSASHRRSTWLLPRPRPHNRDLHLTLTPETASAAAAENGKVRLPLGPMGARGAGAVPQLLP